jgi:hypothetical protein
MYMCLNQRGLAAGELYSELSPSSTENATDDPPGGNQTMKLLVNASIFSVVFAGFVAGAVTIKPTAQFPTTNHSLVVSHAMPVPSCDPDTGCAF